MNAKILSVLVILMLVPNALAATEGAPYEAIGTLVESPHTSSPPAEYRLAYPHPIISADSTWAGAMVIIVLGMFLAAAIIGPIVRLEVPEEVPAAHSHDEPPGASHQHGPGGTVQPGPEHDLPGGHAQDHH